MIIPETYFTVSEQLQLFGLSCICGALLGLIYDVFRLIRIMIPHNFWLTAMEDIIYFGFYGVFITAFTSAAARGEFRVYYIIGNILGFVIYFFTAGSIVVRTMRKLMGLLKRLFSLIIMPFRKIFVLIYKKALVKFVGSTKSLVKSIKIYKNPLLNVKKMLYNNRESKKRKNVTNVAKKSKKNKKSKASEKNKKTI